MNRVVSILLGLPAIFIGALAMYRRGLPILIWGQGILVAAIFILLYSYFYKKDLNFKPTRFRLLSLVLLLFLASSFLDPGIEGVHRWLSVGGIQLNLAMVLAPQILLELYKPERAKSRYLVILATSLLLFFQPDASQLTAFGLSAIIIICRKKDSIKMSLFIIILLSLIVYLGWLNLDGLAPVGHVEEILEWVAQMGWVFLVLGLLSLMALPLPFFMAALRHERESCQPIGFYYLFIILTGIFGNFPLPLMGYGISPLIGYYLSIFCCLGPGASQQLG